MPTKRKTKPAVGSKASAGSSRLDAIRAAAARLPVKAPAQQTYFLFVSRSEPKGRRFIRLRARSVLAWFQRVWKAEPEVWQAELGGHVYGLSRLFDRIEELKLSPPTSPEELLRLLKEHVYYERNLEAEGHFVHVETDDDEVEVNYYFFDDAFLQTADALDRLPSADSGHSPRWGDDVTDDAFASFIRALPSDPAS